MVAWRAADIPDQAGRSFVVTGANSGIGAVAARELARAGAHVVLAVRDPDRGRIAAAGMGPGVEVRRLDLADLASVRDFAQALPGGIDVLINNAGVMAPPLRRTADGFELQLGTNHLGHFALTGLLLTRVIDRVVTVSSAAHRMGRIAFDDLQSERGYEPWRAYGQSKLANLLFAFELDRRLRDADWALRSVACHPGYSATNLQAAGPRMEGSRLKQRIAALGNRVLAQSDTMGALPTLYAATFPDLPGAAYVGPDGPFEMRGHPRIVGAAGRARDARLAGRLWERSEQLTAVTFEFGAATVPAA